MRTSVCIIMINDIRSFTKFFLDDILQLNMRNAVIWYSVEQNFTSIIIRIKMYSAKFQT